MIMIKIISINKPLEIKNIKKKSPYELLCRLMPSNKLNALTNNKTHSIEKKIPISLFKLIL